MNQSISCSNKYALDLTLIGVNLVDDSINTNRNNEKSINLNNETNNSNNNNSIININSSCLQSNRLNGDILGFVTLNSLSIKLNEFRKLMYEQIQTLPTKFIFLSKEGWPVSHIQEMNLNLYYVTTDSYMVLIRRQFEKQRFGVQFNGMIIGFIFAEMEYNATQLRELINQELKGILRQESSFSFIDRNGWPVTMNQENGIKVWDLMRNGMFYIIGIKRLQELDVTDYSVESPDESSETPQKKLKRNLEASTVDIRTVDDSTHNTISHVNNNQNPSQNPNKNSTAIMQASTTIMQASTAIMQADQIINMDFSTIHTPQPSTASIYSSVSAEVKPILISYVRAEAEQHARQLKSELTDLGCNVFLDVDEIEGGEDWADALNKAVLNCDLFVPLITPQYGYTQWTNREVKLADIKQKQIIPISFLDTWPPECLAIQFASTQYIPWKKPVDFAIAEERGEGERARDIKFWDQPYVRASALAISEHYRTTVNTNPLNEQINDIGLNNIEIPIQGVPQGMTTLSATLSPHPERPTSLTPISLKEKSLSRLSLGNISINSGNKKHMSIVISAHPMEKDFVEYVREELTKLGFDVWSSTDMTIGSAYQVNDNLLTPDFNSPPTPKLNDVSSSDDPGSDQTVYLGPGSQCSESSQESQLLTPSDNNYSQNWFQKTPRFSLEHEQTNQFHNYSQTSDCFASQISVLSPEDLDKARNFRHRVDSARIVILILSQQYCKSRICKQQAFYCHYRKDVIPIKYENFQLPICLSKFFDDDILERNKSNEELFKAQLKQKALKLIGSSRDLFKSEMSEARITSLASYVAKKIPVKGRDKVFVYITGSTKFFNPRSESICRAIGQALASIPFVVLVTGGCYGVAETTGRSFCEERELLLKEKPANLYHIIPKFSSQDYSLKARQNPDGSFQNIPFGQTIFIGDSFKERDSVVAQMFNYCILIEGGPRSARIAEEFMWNDNIVVPIICTGGASAGSFDLPAKIHDVPLGVHREDWSTVIRRDVTAENIADAVKNIICSLVKCRSRKKSKHHSGWKLNKSKQTKNKSKS